MELRTYEVEFAAGGYPTPVYRGTVKVGLLIAATDNENDIEQRVFERAKRRVSEQMAMARSMVNIKGFELKSTEQVSA